MRFGRSSAHVAALLIASQLAKQEGIIATFCTANEAIEATDFSDQDACLPASSSPAVVVLHNVFSPNSATSYRHSNSSHNARPLLVAEQVNIFITHRAKAAMAGQLQGPCLSCDPSPGILLAAVRAR